MAPGSFLIRLILGSLAILSVHGATDTNDVYDPCGDTVVQKNDGFSFGIAFSSRESFYANSNPNGTQLSPCDSRLSLSSSNAKLAVFRPNIDQISLLTVNGSNFMPDQYGGYMVAFAGRKYAARSIPSFIANSTYIISSVTLVLEFQEGRLQNLYWKRDNCDSCAGDSKYVCLNGLDCATKTQNCRSQGCIVGIQLAFSGTDKHYSVLNSWYEVENMQQYSLFNLYSNLKSSLANLF